MPCSTWHVHNGSLKNAKTRIRLADLGTLKIACEYPIPFSRQMPEMTTEVEGNCKLLSQNYSSENIETEILRHMNFLHYVPIILDKFGKLKVRRFLAYRLTVGTVVPVGIFGSSAAVTCILRAQSGQADRQKE